ncbi:hypothetical protein EVJ50_05095 [Synechococcus sp. RSCCF101]|uniref:Hfq-related RNA-binding protein n=1 Tax=Synechococcus sp. RSCCF101 TaxID=2511069 RepID=UPI00124514DC|nr:hypothetical protein [Synechococcus sp. RSCCF101]QEY31713.1 hypothetical protein EVJ50_05095 [Synechococcus sp. RSCCF101]
METLTLDPSLPGVRQLQQWIREKRAVSIELPNGRMVEGTIRWQDTEFIALSMKAGRGPLMINRRTLSLIRPLP